MSTALAFTRAHLASIARELACRQLAGDEHQAGRAIEMFLAPFRSNSNIGFPWGAAFVYHCVHAAGLDLPASNLPDLPAFACVRAWTAWARGNACYYPADADFIPDVGDLIIFNNLLGTTRNDHIGVIVDQTEHAYVTAEGNVKNRTGMFVRRKGCHITGFVLLLEAGESADVVLAARVQQRAAVAERPHAYGQGKRAGIGGPAQRMKLR